MSGCEGDSGTTELELEGPPAPPSCGDVREERESRAGVEAADAFDPFAGEPGVFTSAPELPSYPVELEETYSASRVAALQLIEMPTEPEVKRPTSLPPVRPATVPPPARKKRHWSVALLIAGVVGANFGLGAALLRVRSDVKQVREAPAAAATQIEEVKTEQGVARKDIDDAKKRLDEHARVLAQMEAAAKHQEEAIAETKEIAAKASTETKELAAKEARDIATVNTRVNRAEQNVYTMGEAMQILDLIAPAKATQKDRASPTPPSLP